MGLTEQHWFEDEEPEPTERQLEEYINDLEKAYKKGYTAGYKDGSKKAMADTRGKTMGDLPSAQPRWISVTERLPKPNETVGRVLKHYLVQDIYGDMLVGIWDGVNWQMSCSIEVIDDVVAWMPLPKPYKESK